jgi:hypothetical protein
MSKNSASVLEWTPSPHRARIFKRLWSPGMNSASLFSLASRYDNPIPPRFLSPIDSSKIPALYRYLVHVLNHQGPTREKSGHLQLYIPERLVSRL